MNILLLCLCFIFPVERVNLDDYEIGSPGSVRIYKVNDQYLISSAADSLMLLIDQNAQVAAVYDKQGNGPGELKLPGVLGVTDDEILVYSRDKAMMVFDHHQARQSQSL